MPTRPYGHQGQKRTEKCIFAANLLPNFEMLPKYGRKIRDHEPSFGIVSFLIQRGTSQEVQLVVAAQEVRGPLPEYLVRPRGFYEDSVLAISS